MTMLTNSPAQAALRLERRQSYSLGIYCKVGEKVADLTGCTLTFVMAQQPYAGGAIVLTKSIDVEVPLGGFARLVAQAADMDVAPGTYLYAITILTAEGYSGLLVKGEVEVEDNTDPAANGTFTGPGSSNTITLQLMSNNTLHLKVNPMFRDGQPYADAAAISAAQAAASATTAQTAASSVSADAAAADADAATASSAAAAAANSAAQAAADVASVNSLNIAIGTVTTGAPGSSASVTITGTAPNLTMNLTIPRGNDGAVGRKTLTYRPDSPLAVGLGATRIYNDTGSTWTIRAIRASVDAAPSGGPVTVDVNKNGITVFTTQANRPSIVSGQYTAKVTNMDVTSVADGDYLTVDVDVVTAPASGLLVQVVVD